MISNNLCRGIVYETICPACVGNAGGDGSGCRIVNNVRQRIDDALYLLLSLFLFDLRKQLCLYFVCFVYQGDSGYVIYVQLV